MKRGTILVMCAAILSGAVFLTKSVDTLAYEGTVTSLEDPRVDDTVPAVTGWNTESYSGSLYAVWTNRLTETQNLCIEWSKRADFRGDTKHIVMYSNEQEYGMSQHFQKGQMYYVRAYVIEKVRVNDRPGGWHDEIHYGPYSPTLTMTQRSADVEVLDFEILKNRVLMRLGSEASATGYEIQRAEGTGKYKRIAKISDNVYEDTQLQEGHTYRYRIRTFVFDKTNRLTTYGAWKYCSAAIWGEELEVKASQILNGNIKVSWKCVPGASGYRVYRMAGACQSQTVTKGRKKNYRNYQLLQTFTKPSAKKYIDKISKEGGTYTYVVEAYKDTRSGSKVVQASVVRGSDTAVLDFEKFAASGISRKADGSVRLTWKRKHDVDGYLVRRYNSVTGRYEKYQRLSAKAVAYTCPKASPGTVQKYIIYAYQGNEYSDGIPVTTTGYYVDRPGNIRAYATADGQGTQISWNPVPGAVYYRVYRSRHMVSYDADCRSYDFRGGDPVNILKPVYGGVTDEIHSNHVVDQRIETVSATTGERKVINEGPEQGLVYYYYVQAFILDEHYTMQGSVLYSKPARVFLNEKFGKPVISSAKSKSGGQITVTWKKVAGAARYDIYRAEKKNGEYTLAGKTAKNSFKDKKLRSGKKYYYKVKAYRPNAVGADLYSALSAVKAATAR